MPIFISESEPNEIVKLLNKLNLAVEVKHIGSGDYVFGDVAIERKTITDLVNSVCSGSRHLWDQLDTMRRTYTTPILLIEGDIEHRDRLTAGILTTIILFWKYQTIFSGSHEDTASWIASLFTKYGVGKSGRLPPAAVIRADTPREIRVAMLQCIRGIGPVTATKIMDKIPDLFKASFFNIKTHLLEVKGLKKEALEMLIKVKEDD